MTSKSIYKPFVYNQYCVYHTTYSGYQLPANYIGSTSVKKINEDSYHGSVKSKSYKSIWLSELKEHPELFKTEIISYHDTRPDATYKELQLQKIFNVVKNPLFINMSYAAPNGFFGMSTKGIPKTDEHKKNMRGGKRTEETKKNISVSLTGKKRKPFTEQTKTNMSVSRKGIRFSESHILNMTESKALWWKLTNPLGEIMYIKNLAKFCRENDLISSSMCHVSRGDRTDYNGWKCAKDDRHII
jgi:hypothetical protein